MNYLEKKIQEKYLEVLKNRHRKPVSELTKSRFFNRESISLSNAIKQGSGIIAEFKRKSPSAGDFNMDGSLLDTVRLYQKNGVSGYSILTDSKDFGGSISDIEDIRPLVDGPILRKDFIVDEYQIFEAKAAGADAILLIAAALDEFHCENLAFMAKSIGLEVLMEFHTKDELVKMNKYVDVIGINNRDLKTLKTDLKYALELIKYLPYEAVKIAESGVKSDHDLRQLIAAGYDGALIGEFLLKSIKNSDVDSVNDAILP